MRAGGWGVLLCLASWPALAQVETVVVTGRPPDPVGNAAFSVANIDTATIHRYEELDRALEQVPGLSAFRRDSCISANPTTQGVSLRSIAPSGASRTLVTLDGVPQNDPFGGWVLWCSLPTSDLAGAEIVRGAGAGPYGAGALTGVIALDEAAGSGLYAGDVSGSSLDLLHASGAGGLDVGPIELFASASSESTSGWNAVSPEQRGPADDNKTLDARNGSLRLSASPDSATVITARASLYDEGRHSGLEGETSDAKGETASLTVAHQEQPDELGWRLQAWLRDTDFVNVSDSIATARAFTTPADDEYATPAVGWGGSGEVRGGSGGFNWALGLDGRATSGDTKEHFSFVSGAFKMNRVAGGKTSDGGIYAETAERLGDWLLTLGGRVDAWASTDGHLLQSVISTGAITLDQHFASRHGVLPTARAGARYNFGNYYVRAAGYEGFRTPTLNELYRPFRMGNNFTLANPDLAPETLYGAEVGVGGDIHGFVFNATGFWNRLHDPVTNVTIGHGPGTFPPPAGFIPAGGLVIERENVGDIDAFGLEADARYAFATNAGLDAAFDLVNAKVSGGNAAPQLDGKRPSEAPRWTVTGGIDVEPIDRLTLDLDLRYETKRYADDQNTLVLPAATSLDAKAAFTVIPGWSVYFAVDNLLNARIATDESADFVYDYDFPRMFRIGIQFERPPSL